MLTRSILSLLAFLSIFAIAATSVDAYESVEVPDAGAIVGTVRLVEAAPEVETLVVNRDHDVCAREEKYAESLVVTTGGGVRNVVASLSGIDKGKAWDEGKPRIDQKGCRFDPHVLLVRAGEGFDVNNSDDILHMIRARADSNRPFNVGQPKFNKSLTKVLHNPEIVQVTCDVHDWMNAYIVVQEHPYYAVSDENGSFRLDDVPPGEYELTLWHERLGQKTGKVTVDPTSATTVRVELKLRADAAIQIA